MADAAPTDDARRWPAWAVLAAVVLAVVAIRLRLAPMPLERDEGEYAYAGQLLLAGVPPYRAVYNMKFPGVYAAYAAIEAVLGQTAVGVHRGVAVVVAANVAMTFALARRWRAGSGAAAAIVMGVFAVDPASLSLAGHATHFVLLPAVGGLLVLSTGGRAWRAAVGGALLGTAVLMKQPAAAFVLLGAALAWRDGRWRRTAALAAGVAVPVLVMVAALAAAGVLRPFWYWAVRYAAAYGGQLPVSTVWTWGPIAFGAAARFTWPLWTVATVGLTVGWRRRADRPAATFRLGLAAAGLVAASAGFYYRPHYFILITPAVALLAAAALAAAAGRRRSIRAAVAWAAFAVACGGPVVAARSILFELTPARAIAAVYPDRSLLVAPTVAAYVAAHAPPSATVAVLGSEPEIPFYARRRSATGHIYTFPLTEPQPFAAAMQRDFAAEVEAARPAYVVVVHDQYSWFVRPNSVRWILDWMPRYLAGKPLVGVADLSADPPRLYWDAAVASPAAQRVAHGPGPSLLVYRGQP